jgi:hypothetical protein
MPGAVAVGFYPAGGPLGLAIYDNGVQRPNGLPTYSGLLFSPDGQYLFQNGEPDFLLLPDAVLPQILRYTVDSSGIPQQTPLTAAGAGPAGIAAGALYTSSGEVIDYSGMTLSANFGISGPIALDPSNQRAYVLYNPPIENEILTPVAQLQAFMLPTLDALGSQPVALSSINTLNAPEGLSFRPRTVC